MIKTSMNIPEIFKNKNHLFIGAGGGFDIFAAIPLKLASDSSHSLFASFGTHKGFKVRKSTEDDYPICKLVPHTYTLGKNGVQDVKDGIQELVDKYDVDTIFAVDGGVDSLMRGDEEDQGTVLEDFIVLAAIDQVNVREKYLACCGFGCETEENLNHYRALENIANLIKNDQFLGSCSLIKGSIEYNAYKRICEEAWADNRRKSHIQSKIILATDGEFGDVGMDGVDAQVVGYDDSTGNPNFISPLMPIYWFFRLEGVVANNLVIDKIKESRSFTDAMMLYRQSIQKPTRDKLTILL